MGHPIKLLIASRDEKGFRRCKKYFGPTPTVFEVTEEEAEVLKAEKRLIVMEVPADPKPATQAKK